MEPRTDQEFERIKLKLKGAWVLISGTNNGWPIDRTAQADSIRQAIKQENKEIDQKNAELRKRNREKGENNKMIPYKEFPALYYHEMVEAGALGFIQSSEVPIRALYDRKMIDSMTFDNLPEVPDIKLDGINSTSLLRW
jgi:carboxypeptidase Q